MIPEVNKYYLLKIKGFSFYVKCIDKNVAMEYKEQFSDDDDIYFYIYDTDDAKWILRNRKIGTLNIYEVDYYIIKEITENEIMIEVL